MFRPAFKIAKNSRDINQLKVVVGRFTKDLEEKTIKTNNLTSVSSDADIKLLDDAHHMVNYGWDYLDDFYGQDFEDDIDGDFIGSREVGKLSIVRNAESLQRKLGIVIRNKCRQLLERKKIAEKYVSLIKDHIMHTRAETES